MIVAYTRAFRVSLGFTEPTFHPVLFKSRFVAYISNDVTFVINTLLFSDLKCETGNEILQDTLTCIVTTSAYFRCIYVLQGEEEDKN